MPQPRSRGGADSVKFMGGSSARMEVLEVDEDANVKQDGWFAYVNPTQTGVEMMPSLRFGWWEERPNILAESDLIIIGDIDGENGKDEPVLIISPINQTTCFVAQSKHITAQPLPVLKDSTQP